LVDLSRIEDLRRRVHRDPSSIAFAQLAEELRRSGAWQEAVDVCRSGLALHPNYLSARVTLGRALLELGALDDARTELEAVLPHAPDNLAARRALGDICNRHGEIDAALEHYRVALLVAPNDPDLEVIVALLDAQIETAQAAEQEAAAALAALHEDAFQTFESPAPVLSAVSSVAEPDPAHDRGLRMVAVLESWLDAIHVTRTDARA